MKTKHIVVIEPDYDQEEGTLRFLEEYFPQPEYEKHSFSTILDFLVWLKESNHKPYLIIMESRIPFCDSISPEDLDKIYETFPETKVSYEANRTCEIFIGWLYSWLNIMCPIIIYSANDWYLNDKMLKMPGIYFCEKEVERDNLLASISEALKS